jgi:acyl-coenzyme A thioesterase PaaI-like protein
METARSDVEAETGGQSGTLFPTGDEPGSPTAPAEREALAAYTDAMRRALDAAAQARPPAGNWLKAAEHARALTDLFAPYAGPESQRIVGQLRDLPGRGQVLVPPFRVTHRDEQQVLAEVTLDHTHLGANGAAHGGVLPLLFDELLGQFANSAGRTRARTAYLHVDYRKITPIGVPLRLRAAFVSEEGRKRLLTGTAHAGDVLVADARGLFVELREGQP